MLSLHYSFSAFANGTRVILCVSCKQRFCTILWMSFLQSCPALLIWVLVSSCLGYLSLCFYPPTLCNLLLPPPLCPFPLCHPPLSPSLFFLSQASDACCKRCVRVVWARAIGVCVCLCCACVWLYECVCLNVCWESERERTSERERERETDRPSL